MPYPPFLLRRTSFREKENAGEDLSTADLDAEQNDETSIINELNRRLRLIQDVQGKLINVASQISQALVGAERQTSTLGQTVFTTGITWDSAFSALNVQLVNNGDTVDSDDVTVADNAGFLEVTVAGSVIEAGWVLVAAFSQGAGIEARLGDTGDVLNGAVMIGVYDVDGNFISTNVEGVLAELKAAIDAITTALGSIASIWTKDGTSIDGSPAADDFNLGNQKIVNLADGVADGDAVNMAQLAAATQSLAEIIALFIRADGQVEFTANQSMGGFKLTDLAAPTDPDDATNKTYVDAQIAAAADTSVAVNGLKASATRGTLTGPLTFGQDATDTADADQTTAPAGVAVQTIAGIPKPGAADHVANRQYVDEAIANAITGSSLRSPYAAFVVPLPAYGTDASTDLDGAITNIAAGGVLMGSGLTVSVPQTLTADTHIFIDGDVSITAAIDCGGHILEISATGVVVASAAISNALDVRIRSGGALTISAAITASAFAGVITLDSIGVLTVSGALNALMIFAYSVATPVVSSTWTAKGGRRSTAAWGSTYWNLDLTYGRNVRDLLSAGHDYMTPYSGCIGVAGGGSSIGGAGTGGGGAVAGGRGRTSSSSGTLTGRVAAARGVGRPWLLPASPGGCAGEGGASPLPSQVNSNFGGGVIVLVTPGDATLTGAVFDASGSDSGGNAGSGGGGGSVKIAVRGIITDGECRADGGHGQTITGSGDGAGGGGGIAYMVTAGVAAGVQVYSVAGGENGNAAIFAEDGVSGTVVLSSGDEWDTLRDQGFFDR
jgi:hypothetical protein